MNYAFIGAGAMGGLTGCIFELAGLTEVSAPHISSVYACTKLLDTRIQALKQQNLTTNTLRTIA